MKTFRPYQPDQLLLLPPSIQEWLPEGHLARFVSEVVDELDLSAIEDQYTEERGYPPYHPRMMVKVLVYGYCTGTYASRRLATGDWRPSWSTMWRTAPRGCSDVRGHRTAHLANVRKRLARVQTGRGSGATRSIRSRPVPLCLLGQAPSTTVS
jgi:hypothetical protein